MSEETIVPSSPADRKKIRGMVEEAALSMQKMSDQRAHYKDIFTRVKEEANISTKHFKQLVDTYYKQNYRDKQSEQHTFEILYESIFEINDNE